MRFILFFLLLSFTAMSQPSNTWDEEIGEEKMSPVKNKVLGSDALYGELWHYLPQPLFWKQIMLLSPDSCLVNVAATRQVIERLTFKKWSKQTEAQKAKYKDSLRVAHKLADGEQLFVTSGKSDFYRFNDVYPSIAKGVQVFEAQGVDPWYAQAILLIESPGQLAKSNAGAYGAFQLMPSVARAQGLIVNKNVDERSDFNKSAMGSARLINRVCIPEAKKILDAHNIAYTETDLWFRLFVLHVYHAGAMNVSAVVNKINPVAGSQDLIKQMWQTSAASFGNSSQNYTQLALASQLILCDLVAQKTANETTTGSLK